MNIIDGGYFTKKQHWSEYIHFRLIKFQWLTDIFIWQIVQTYLYEIKNIIIIIIIERERERENQSIDDNLQIIFILAAFKWRMRRGFLSWTKSIDLIAQMFFFPPHNERRSCLFSKQRKFVLNDCVGTRFDQWWWMLDREERMINIVRPSKSLDVY